MHELEEAAYHCLRLPSVGPGIDDNRPAWHAVITGNFRNGVPFRVLPRLVRYYLSVAEGTVDLERHLGTLWNAITPHKGPAADKSTWAMLEVLLDGPREE
eukprot:11178875-Lingulodinium_polyedra.AAC.1